MNASVIKTVSRILDQMSKVNQSTLTQIYGNGNNTIDEESDPDFEPKKKGNQ